jgi:hypothetical protein
MQLRLILHWLSVIAKTQLMYLPYRWRFQQQNIAGVNRPYKVLMLILLRRLPQKIKIAVKNALDDFQFL